MVSHGGHVFFASASGISNSLLFNFITYPREKGSMQTIVAESTTLRRHIEANHVVSEFYYVKHSLKLSTLSLSTTSGVTRTISSQNFLKQSRHEKMRRFLKTAQSSHHLTHTLKNAARRHLLRIPMPFFERLLSSGSLKLIR